MIIVETLTPEERARLLASLIRYTIKSGELEASTLRTMILKVENGE